MIIPRDGTYSSTIPDRRATLTFGEALDEDSAPAASAFTVTVAENARTVDAVSVSGSAVTLTLASAVASGETVTVPNGVVVEVPAHTERAMCTTVLECASRLP